MTNAELIAERRDMVSQLHAAMAILDAVLDKITLEAKRKRAPTHSRKKGKAKP
jgi:hypothetical protein